MLVYVIGCIGILKVNLKIKSKECSNMENLKKWVADVLVDNVMDFDSLLYDGCELLETYNMTGSYECNSWKARKWIKNFMVSDYGYDLRNFVEDYANNFGDEFAGETFKKAFTNPEVFQVIVMLFISDSIIGEYEVENDLNCIDLSDEQQKADLIEYLEDYRG